MRIDTRACASPARSLSCRAAPSASRSAGRGTRSAVTPIPAAAASAPAALVPVLDAGAGPLGAVAGKPVTRVAVVLEGNVWDDVEVPAVTIVKAGDAAHAGRGAPRARRAPRHRGLRARPRDGDARGRRASSWSCASSAQAGQAAGVDLHGARVDYDEMLRDAGLAEGGEVVGAEIGEAAARIDRDMALHGYPTAHATVQTRATDDPTRTLVVVDIVPGRSAPRRRARLLRASGRAATAPAGDVRVHGVHVPATAPTPRALDTADTALEQALHTKGWYRARVSHDLVWVGRRRAGPAGRAAGAHRRRRHCRSRSSTATTTTTRARSARRWASTRRPTARRAPRRQAPRLLPEARLPRRRGPPRGARRREDGVAPPVEVVVFHVDEHARVGVGSRRYPCLKLDAIRHLSDGGPRSSAEIGTEIDSFLDEELPGTRAARRPQPVGPEPDHRRRRRPERDRHPPHPPRARPRPHLRRRHVRPRAPSTCRSSIATRASSTPRSARCRSSARSATRARRGRVRAAAAPAARHPGVHLRRRGPAPADRSPSTRATRAGRIRRTASSARPSVQLVVPIKLGPRTQLWDVAFTGLKSVSEKEVADAAQVPLGDFVSTTKLDEARRRIVDWYKELGLRLRRRQVHAGAVARQHARPRALRRDRGRPGLRQLHRRPRAGQHARERRPPAHRARRGRAVPDQRRAQDPGAPGDAGGLLEHLGGARRSLRAGADQGGRHRRRGARSRSTWRRGRASRPARASAARSSTATATSSATRGRSSFHVQASYLPDFLDPRPAGASRTTCPSASAQRIATRDTVTLAWPEMGLGPTVRSQIDGVYVRDLEPDFILAKTSALGSMTWRPQSARCR